MNGILENKKVKDINNFTGTNNLDVPIKPSSYSIPVMLGRFGPGYEAYVDYYQEIIEYIADYKVICDEEYCYIKFEQKNRLGNQSRCPDGRLKTSLRSLWLIPLPSVT